MILIHDPRYLVRVSNKTNDVLKCESLEDGEVIVNSMSYKDIKSLNRILTSDGVFGITSFEEIYEVVLGKYLFNINESCPLTSVIVSYKTI